MAGRDPAGTGAATLGVRAMAGVAAMGGMVVAGTAVAGTVAEVIGTAVEAIAGNSLEIPRAGLSAVKYWT
jgi:hypothetical protein